MYCLVRPGAGNTADERFFQKVATSRGVRSAARRARRRLRRVHAREDRRARRRHRRGRSATSPTSSSPRSSAGGSTSIINSAGLVSFAPSLESALRINALGAKNVLDVGAQARRAAGARLDLLRRRPARRRRVGGRAGRRLLPAQHAIARDCGTRTSCSTRLRSGGRDRRLPAHHRSGARARRTIASTSREFRERGRRALRDAAPRSRRRERLKIAVARERKMWMNDVLTEARHGARAALGLDEHVHVHEVARRADHPRRTARVPSTIVRPAIVESAVRYPFPGWNEGFNTTAPLMYLMLKGHRTVPMGDGHRARRHPGRLHRRRHAARDRGGARRRARAGLSARLVAT